MEAENTNKNIGTFEVVHQQHDCCELISAASPLGIVRLS